MSSYWMVSWKTVVSVFFSLLCISLVLTAWVTIYVLQNVDGERAESSRCAPTGKHHRLQSHLNRAVTPALTASDGGTMCDRTLQYFSCRGLLTGSDASLIKWSHGVNSRDALAQALSGPCHMIEADVTIRGHDPKEPIMAHPPDTDSDITLKKWLENVKMSNKGIKLDFKSLEAVSPSLALLEAVLAEPGRPVWVNADILTGPGGQNRPVDAQAFLSVVTALPAQTVLSLGWTTGWTAGTNNSGYSWDMVHMMEEKCRDLKHPVTFPVRAALLAQSFSQLSWLLQQSDRYTLTVWTGQHDEFALQDFKLYRKAFDVNRIYYDLPNSLKAELSMMTWEDD